MLGNRDDHRLVGRRGHDRAHAVGARAETSRDRDDDVTIGVRGGIDTLEEGERLRICEGGAGERGDGFDDDVGVANDLALSVERLRVGEVGLRGVGEDAELHSLDL